MTRPRTRGRRNRPATPRRSIVDDFRVVDRSGSITAGEVDARSLDVAGPGAGPFERCVLVERVVPTRRRDELRGRLMWEIALDQRAFGPRRVLVAFADRDGRLIELDHTERTDPPELAFGLCLRTAAPGASAAVVYCDEAVDARAARAELEPVIDRFLDAGSFAREHFGVHLVDWIACDDQMFRSSRLLHEPDADMWAMP